MLKLRNIHAGYGRSEVLFGINLDVAEGEVVSMVGPNGAGKTTLARVISGLLRPTKGSATFGEANLGRLSPAAIVRAGIAQVPEGAGIFRELTVKENLQLADTSSVALEEMTNMFPALQARLELPAASLSGGERQMLGVARALLLRPRLLILDEPSLGLAPRIVSEVFAFLQKIRATGRTSILLVEQNFQQSLNISDRGYILVSGKCVYEGAAITMLSDDSLTKKYLSLS